jgi:hypothetical protein
MEVKYNGSIICLLSAQLFLIASLFNLFYCKNYIDAIVIFLLYITSILYHYNGDKFFRKIDIMVTRFAILTCIITSLFYKNILPSIFTLFVIFFYYMNFSSSPTYHALSIHLIGFFGFLALYYNKNNNNK